MNDRLKTKTMSFKTKPGANNGVLQKIPYYFSNLEKSELR